MLMMCSISKSLALILSGAIVTLCLITVQPANAQSIPKPSVPEFTAKPIFSPPENQSVNKTIELSIKNQPSVLAYNVRMRINDGNWRLLYPNNNSVPIQSDGEYTILSYSSGYLGVEYQYNLGYTSQNLSAGDKVDFQVQAMIGSIQRVFNPNFTSQLDMYPYVFIGESSGWSNTQTIRIPDGLSSPNSTLSPTPSVPELSWLIILPLLVATFTYAVVGLFRRHNRNEIPVITQT